MALTGISHLICLIPSRSSNPHRDGLRRSVRRRSILFPARRYSRIMDSASSPFAASTTSYPSLRRTTETEKRKSASSSTIRMRGFASTRSLPVTTVHAVGILDKHTSLAFFIKQEGCHRGKNKIPCVVNRLKKPACGLKADLLRHFLRNFGSIRGKTLETGRLSP